ncbi:MAG: hypothetical protein AAFM91_19585, partial [Pseudomonadota bacterium]
MGCTPNKALQLALMDPASVSLPQNAHRVNCATELGCYKACSYLAQGLRWGLLAVVAVIVLLPSAAATAEECVAIDSDLEALVNAYSARTGTKFVLDPRVR